MVLPDNMSEDPTEKIERRYEQAEPLYVQALTVASNRLGHNHPNTQEIINNFVRFVSTVVEAKQQEQLSDQPLTQHILEFMQFQK